MNTYQVGQKLVEMCRKGDFSGAMEALYAPDIVSVEATGGGGDFPRTISGIEAVRQKGAWWEANHEVHGFEASGPFPHDDRFAVLMKLDVTPKVGPMANQRMQMEEVGIYTVRNGKISKEEFFYHMG